MYLNILKHNYYSFLLTSSLLPFRSHFSFSSSAFLPSLRSRFCRVHAVSSAGLCNRAPEHHERGEEYQRAPELITNNKWLAGQTALNKYLKANSTQQIRLIHLSRRIGKRSLRNKNHPNPSPERESPERIHQSDSSKRISNKPLDQTSSIRMQLTNSTRVLAYRRSTASTAFCKLDPISSLKFNG